MAARPVPVPKKYVRCALLERQGMPCPCPSQPTHPPTQCPPPQTHRNLPHDDDEKDGPLVSLNGGVPMRFQGKTAAQAVAELEEVVGRVGGRVTQQGEGNGGVLRAVFPQQAQQLAFHFAQGEGGAHSLQAHAGAGLEDMRLLNVLADGLASKGGWATTGFPLSCEPAMARYA